MHRFGTPAAHLLWGSAYRPGSATGHHGGVIDVVERPPAEVRTAAGRVVTYYEYGDRDGTPVIAMHGTPACGAGFAPFDGPARERGIRLLAPNRAGIAGSTRLPARAKAQVRDYVPDLVAFADAVGVDNFSALGYSGGAPYALAVAHAEPERVHATAIVSGAGNVGAWASLSDYHPSDRSISKLALRAPVMAHVALATSATLARVAPRVSVWFARREMAPPDRAVVARYPSARAAVALFTEAFSGGGAGIVDDYAALSRPWGFDVTEIRVPVHCWHATADRVVPLDHSRALHERVPRAGLTTWDGEGHLAVILRSGEVLDGLLELTRR